MPVRTTAAVAAVATALLTGCATVITGTPTWPGATLERVLLTAKDFPPGVEYGRIVDAPGQPDNLGAPPSMLSSPQNCSNGLTDVIRGNAQRGPGSAGKYNVVYDGARIVMTVLTWQLDLDALAAEASRCARFDTFFDRNSKPIPITTVKLPSQRSGQLVYQQTLRLGSIDTSIYMSFENVGKLAVFGVVFPFGSPPPGQPAPPKASLPQTFTEIADRQAARIQAG